MKCLRSSGRHWDVFSRQILLTLLAFSFVGQGNTSKILFFFSAGTYSHKVGIWPLVSALVDRGHNVTFVSSFDRRPSEVPHVVDIAPREMMAAMEERFGSVDRLSHRLRHEEGKLWHTYHSDLLRSCKNLLSILKSNPDLNRIFYTEKFDVMVNNFIFGDCGYILAHRLIQDGTRLILYDSSSLGCWWPDLFGFPAESSSIPIIYNAYEYPMNFWDRMRNYLSGISWFLKRHWQLLWPLEVMMKEVYPNLDSYSSLVDVERNASLIFVNTHHATDYARSVPPFVVNIGGMQCWQKHKPLDGEFKEYLDSAQDGAVLIAFGSTINLARAPPLFMQMFFDTMRKFPNIKFIWRWDGPLPEDHPPNLKAAKWLPQYQILGHPNVKIFISHAGLNSVTEATCQGVPVILLPLFGDQDYNGYHVEAFEIGIRLEARTLTTRILANSVENILINTRYSTNMKRLSRIMMDRPMSSIDTAIYWLEFVIRHEDTTNLKPLNNLYWFQNRMLDVFFFLAFLMADVILILYVLVRCTIRVLKDTFAVDNVREVKRKKHR